MSSTNNQRNRIHLTLPSRLELLGVVDKIVEGITDQMGFEDVDRDAVAISVIEASTNAMQHGHHTDPAITVDLVFEMLEDSLVVTIHDEGPGFEPDLTGDPAPPDLLSTRGRGIFIMRTMMDEISYDFSDGTLLRLVKHRTRPDGDSGAASS